MEIATTFRLQRMTDEEARRTLHQLAAKPMLEGDETVLAWALGDRLGMPVTIQRLALKPDAKWHTLERESA
jgi:hypothetical protein